jgi:hypothetical protein
MKSYIKGNKTLTLTKVSDKLVLFEFWNGKTVTCYYKKMEEQASFLNYMLDVWFKVVR